MSTLYVNGTVHSSSDPYATALLVDGGSVAWVGADDTADQMRARSGAEWEVVDLDGALVTPAFVDSLSLPGPAGGGSGTTPGAGAEPAAAGIFLSVTAAGASSTSGAADDADDAGSAGTTDAVPGLAATVGYHPVTAEELPGPETGPGAVDLADGVAGLAAVVGPGGLHASAVTRLAGAATEAGVQVYFLPEDPDALAAVIDAVRATGDAQGCAATGRARHRVSWNGPVASASVELMARNSMSATVVPDAQGRITTPVASLLSNGVPVSFGSGAAVPSPWSAIRASLEHPDDDQRISARAGFTAATKAGLRALPVSVSAPYGMAGRIAPSAPATFAVWTAEALSVQAPDGRVAAWSTDTRAGTPLLPVLEEGTAAPECLATVVGGAVLYRSPAWT